jgi:hypothetical protein
LIRCRGGIHRDKGLASDYASLHPAQKLGVPGGLLGKAHEKATAQAVAFEPYCSYFQCSELGSLIWQNLTALCVGFPDLGEVAASKLNSRSLHFGRYDDTIFFAAV